MHRTILRRLKRLGSLCLTLTVYPLSGLSPRSPERWVFGHNRDLFAGNPKYLFLWMTLHRPDIRVTWITGSRRTFNYLHSNGLPVQMRWSLPGIITTLRAGVLAYAVLIDDVNFSLSRRAFLLNLWHGVGVKGLSPQDRGAEVAAKVKALNASFIGRMRRLPDTKSPDMLVTTSNFTQQHFARQFSLSMSHCPQFGYPRLDCAHDSALDEFARELNHEQGFKLNSDGHSEIYLYMPTYRDSGRPFFLEAIPDVEQLSHALEARNALLYIKPHPSTGETTPQAHNIRRWPDTIDFQPYLEDISSLITDYSSVLYDYLYVGRGAPILYFFDMDRYESERPLIYDYDANIAGLRATAFQDLCFIIKNGSAIRPKDEVQQEINVVRNRFWGGANAPASPDLVDYVCRQLTS